MPSRPHGPPSVGDHVLILHLAGPEDATVVAVLEHGRELDVEDAEGRVSRFRLRPGSGLYVDERQTRLAFG